MSGTVSPSHVSNMSNKQDQSNTTASYLQNEVVHKNHICDEITQKNGMYAAEWFHHQQKQHQISKKISLLKKRRDVLNEEIYKQRDICRGLKQQIVRIKKDRDELQIHFHEEKNDLDEIENLFSEVLVNLNVVLQRTRVWNERHLSTIGVRLLREYMINPRHATDVEGNAWCRLVQWPMTSNSIKNKKYLFLTRDFYTIGKDPRNDIILSGDSCSRFHAEIRKCTENKGLCLMDIGSSFGTSINFKKIEKKKEYCIIEKCRICFGETEVSFVVDFL